MCTEGGRCQPYKQRNMIKVLTLENSKQIYHCSLSSRLLTKEAHTGGSLQNILVMPQAQEAILGQNSFV